MTEDICLSYEQIPVSLQVNTANNCLNPQDQNTIDFLNTYAGGFGYTNRCAVIASSESEDFIAALTGILYVLSGEYYQ